MRPRSGIIVDGRCTAHGACEKTMTVSGLLIRKSTAAFLAFAISAPVAEASAPPQEIQTQQTRGARVTGLKEQTAGAGEGKGTESAAPLPDAPDAAPVQSADSSGQSSSAQSTPSQEQRNPPRPVGTAAAPATGAKGVMASSPAGAVIAPAKQRRVRAILIRVGIIAGGCAAVGAVVALSHASPSQPRIN